MRVELPFAEGEWTGADVSSVGRWRVWTAWAASMSLSGGAGLSSCLSWRLIPCLLSFYDAAPSGPRALSERPYDSKPPRTAAFTEAWHGPNHLVARNRSGTGAAEKHASQYRSIHSRSYSRYNQYRSPYDYYRYDDSGPEKRHWEHRPYREDEKAEQVRSGPCPRHALHCTLLFHPVCPHPPRLCRPSCSS